MTWRVGRWRAAHHSNTGGSGRAGLYVRDVALELLRSGHRPVVFCRRLGALADELRGLTIPVIDRLGRMTSPPDIIHGNAPIETAAALLHFPETPAIFVCHGWDSVDALPPRLPRILRYVAVDETCLDRLIWHEGIPRSSDSRPLQCRRSDSFFEAPAASRTPGARAGLQQSGQREHLCAAVRRACERFSIDLDVVGESAGTASSAPELILGNYDIVFAKARSALEGLAVGTAVVVCDQTGLGGLVTTENVVALRQQNFGRRALRNPITVDSVACEIAGYDADDATRTSAFVRARRVSWSRPAR